MTSAQPERLPVWRRVAGEHAAWQVFTALGLFSLIYRLRLTAALLSSDVVAVALRDGNFSFTALLRYWLRDLELALGLAILVGLVARLARRLRRPPSPHVGYTLTYLLLLTVGLNFAAHFHLLFSMASPLDFEMMMDAGGALSWGDFWGYVSFTDVAFALSAPLVLWVVQIGSRRVPLFSVPAGIAMLAVAALLNLVHLGEPLPASVIRRDPVVLTVGELWAAIRRPANPYAGLATPLAAEQQRTLRLADPQFARPDPLPALLAMPDGPHPRWNVLWVIMESTGREYVYDTAAGNPVPMPRLHELARRSAQLGRHYASANSSARALLSLFTGLLPEPSAKMFAMRPDAVVPAFRRFLPAAYDAFLVTPSRLDSYFPSALLRNSGLSEIYGYDDLPAAGMRPGPPNGRHEIDTTTFFLERLQRAQEPFFAVYYSYAPHFDYFDYGEPYRLLNDITNPRARYLNNLRVLDDQLGRMLDALAKRRVAERTIVLVVGDHGEAFGQHDNNWTHPRHSYEENFRVPALLYAPGLSPTSLDAPTAHADLLPTLLDLLGLPFNSELMQGESLFGPRRRRYLFMFGQENTLSSLDADGHKLLLSLKDYECWAFNLAEDPGERLRASCRDRPEQLGAMVAYLGFQRDALLAYNAALRAHGDYFGQRQPPAP